MESDEIKTAMDGQSVTQGWDAIAAYNATQVTSVFFQQYLQEGPTNPALPVRVILNTQGSDFWLLDLTTKKTRPLTSLDNPAAMRTFDITPDGKQIVFDRLRENSDIVLIDLR